MTDQHPREPTPAEAPCVAVVGPANSGKTTVLHLLDAALQTHPSAPLVYVVKGNPDGTGRYLRHAPELREALKGRVKGTWSGSTGTTIRRWIDNARASLELVLLDFGGRHAPGNDEILRRCSHFLLVSRDGEEAAEAEVSGGASWWRVCRRLGLEPVARLRSLWGTGEARVTATPAGVLEATFRADASGPGDRRNAVVIDAVAERLLQLRRWRRRPPYLDLRLARDWEREDVADLGGRAGELERRVAAGGTVLLGGRAPVWAYCAALHRALDRDPAAVVGVFDPKLPGARIVIPACRPSAASPLAGKVEAEWRDASATGPAILDLHVATPDRMLDPPKLDHLPPPPGPPPRGNVVVSGAVPIWLHLAYTRWLRTVGGVHRIGVWDARSRRPVWVGKGSGV